MADSPLTISTTPDIADGDGASTTTTDTLADMRDLATPDDLAAPKEKKKKKQKVEIDPSNPDTLFQSLGSTRGVETLFRTSYRVNMDLTSLADSKANIMISINGLMVSILIASIAPKVDANPWLLIPTSIFLVGCLVSLVFAVLSARPRVQSRNISLEESRRHHTNILFFGNFAHLTQEDFKIAMKERMMDPVALYEMMMADIYGVGSVLQRKYQLLRASYGAFIVALVVGVAGFITVFTYAAVFQSGPTIVTPIGVDASTGVPILGAQPLATP